MLRRSVIISSFWLWCWAVSEYPILPPLQAEPSACGKSAANKQEMPSAWVFALERVKGQAERSTNRRIYSCRASVLQWRKNKKVFRWDSPVRTEQEETHLPFNDPPTWRSKRPKKTKWLPGQEDGTNSRHGGGRLMLGALSIRRAETGKQTKYF